MYKYARDFALVMLPGALSFRRKGMRFILLAPYFTYRLQPRTPAPPVSVLTAHGKEHGLLESRFDLI